MPHRPGRVLTVLPLLAVLAAPAHAGPAEVVGVAVVPLADGGWRFDVTVRHDDTGWEHYADAFEVRAPDGTVLGVRELLHPHVEEQPFTRSLILPSIPDAIGEVTVRAHDTVHGHAGAAVTVTLPRR